jgi:membrane-associated phospholipid phosphatase
MLRRNSLFLSLSVLWLVVTGCSLLCFPKAETHLWLNSVHTAQLDALFRHFTVLGEWVPYAIAGLLLFYKAGWAAYLTGSTALSGLISQGLKHLLQTDRPVTWFALHAPEVSLPLVEGVEMNRYLSCPSGHTTSFFALFLVLSVVATDCIQRQAAAKTESHALYKTQSCLVQAACFLLAATGAYSRIYLSQHFLEDIFCGTILGLSVTALLYTAVPPLMRTRFWDWNLQSLCRSRR